MSWLPARIIEAGPWAVVVVLVLAFVVARARGVYVSGREMDRLERRMEKDTDRVLELYKTQLNLASVANVKKDETIAKQAEQIEKLMAHSAVTAHTLAEIMEEARRRGLVQ